MIKNLFLVLFAIAIFTGCASSTAQPSPETKNNQKVEESLVPPKSDIRYFNVNIKRSGYVMRSKVYNQTASEISSQLRSMLKANYPKSIIEVNSDSKHPNGVNIELKVVDFSYVSGAGRFFGGIMAGDARLGVDIKLSDFAKDKIVVEEKFGTSSSKWAGIFGATTSRQIKSLSVFVMNEVNNLEL